jgi:penicillin-binding protein 1C
MMTRPMRVATAAGVIFAGAVLWQLYSWLPVSGIADFATVRARWQPSEAYLLDHDGVLLDSARIDYGVRRFDWVALGDISTALTDAVVAGEDRRFWTHDGVDWRAALGAARDNLTGERRRGASTITMQLATMLRSPNNRDRRGWLDKIGQVRAARAIESGWTKPQILEAYLNLLGFRGELQGIDAAARLLAGKVPSGLSAPESLVLAALLPEPGADLPRIAARACARAQQTQSGVSCDEIETTAHAMFDRAAHLSDTPALAPDLARSLLRRPGEHLLTTLDANVQTLARDVMKNHLEGLAAHNVRDGAALVVDNETGEVLAYVGSAGPASRARHVDGVRAHRQAGSTLKPFLYGLALERRYVTNASLLDDSPVSLDTATGVYLPQNYDRDFKGLVSVRTALGSSLNVPAVRTLVLVGVEAFRDRLHSLGYAGITQDGEFYGYSLALGSAEVSLWEQVNAYRTLARGGMASPLRLRADDPVQSQARIVAADASFLVTDILSDRAARVATFGLDNNLNTAFWSAVKTGTSKDLRDNWCIGFTDRYTVGVWVGNFEGDSMRDVSGVTGAAPAWHDIIVALNAQRGSQPPSPPPGVVQTQVTFAPAVEAPRREWFAAGTEVATVATVPEQAARTHIASPGNGLVIALDPDIPPERQRVPLLARGGTEQLAFRLDGATVGPAAKQMLWSPRSGAHRLALVDASGTVVDEVLFTVR